MIRGIGTDILQLSRIEEALQRTPKLADRILTEDELRQYSEQTDQPRFLAKRFAAKEAVVKALGTGIGRGVGWQHIEICKNQAGKPSVSLTGGAAEMADTLSIDQIHISYTDEREYIVAFAVAEGG